MIEEKEPLGFGRDLAAEYRKLPSVDRLLRQEAIQLFVGEFGQEPVTETIRSLLEEVRQAISQGQAAIPPEAWPARILEALEAQSRPSLLPVINATGVILHTNLGRAPLSKQALHAMREIGIGYNNLEFDLAAGERGSRYDHTRTILSELTGAEDAIVVNNCAAAVYLVLSALCQGCEVLISRGQLVEIGGGFRIPDVLRQSGVRLVEVGTTNRTHGRDFAGAITRQTAAIMRVHSSNFRILGFVTMPTLTELDEIRRSLSFATDATGATQNAASSDMQKPDILLIDDLGSGALLNTATYGLMEEPTVQASIAAGADIVTFSGDKLLGGPQAGIIVGKARLIERIRRHPMARALRVDKLTLAALDATLRSYQRKRATEEIPIWQMIAAPVEWLRQRAEAWQQQLADQGIFASLQAGESAIGGGSLPGETLTTWLLVLAVPHAETVATNLRLGTPAVVCRIQNDCLLFDPRTVLLEQEEMLLRIISKTVKQ